MGGRKGEERVGREKGREGEGREGGRLRHGFLGRMDAPASLSPKAKNCRVVIPAGYSDSQLFVYRIVLAVLYTFLVIFVIVDVTVQTKSYYNLVSLSGIFVYLSIMFLFSIAPRKASTFV